MSIETDPAQKMSEKMKPEEMLKYATKFEFPPTKHLRLSIERSKSINGDRCWFIKDITGSVFDTITGELEIVRIDENTPEYRYLSLEDAFNFANYLFRKEKEEEIDYTGRCRRCGKYVGENNLKEAFGWNFCQECYDKID